MKYKLTVVELYENPNYAAQLQQYEERTRYSNFNGDSSYPQTHIETRTLEIELKEEEYTAVRAAVLAEVGPKRDAR